MNGNVENHIRQNKPALDKPCMICLAYISRFKGAEVERDQWEERREHKRETEGKYDQSAVYLSWMEEF